MSEAETLSRPRDAAALYDRLEERILARDQVGASDVYYDLLRAGRPLPEIMAEGVRIHAPYTHVPYHERIDDGFPNFVNNDHCLLSARASVNLTAPAAALAGRAADGADHLVHPVGARHLEPEDRQGAGPLYARLQGRDRASAGARGLLARSGTGAPRRSVARKAGPMADARASRSGARRLPGVPRIDAGDGKSARGAGASWCSPG